MSETLYRIRAARHVARQVIAGAAGETHYLGGSRAWTTYRPVVVGGRVPTLRLGRCEGTVARLLAHVRAALWAVRHRHVAADTLGAWRAPEGGIELDLGTLHSRRYAPCVLAERGEREGWDVVRGRAVFPCDLHGKASR